MLGRLMKVLAYNSGNIPFKIINYLLVFARFTSVFAFFDILFWAFAIPTKPY